MKKLLFLFSLIVLFSCSDDFENLSKIRLDNSSRQEVKIRNLEKVKNIAKGYMANSQFQGKRMVESINEQDSLEIEVLTLQLLDEIQNSDSEAPIAQLPAKVSSTTRATQDTVMYAVKTGTCTLLIPAFENAAPIFAEMDDPNFSWRILGQNVGGMRNPLEHLIVPALDKNYWEIFGMDTCKVWQRIELEDWESWLYKDVVWPKLEVNWDQNDPFNKYCPGYYHAGCVAIATAQALTITRNWDSFNGIPLNYDNLIKMKTSEDKYKYPNEADTIARLIRYIGDAVNMNYGETASEARTIDAINYFFKPNMNVSSERLDYRNILKKPKGIIIVSSRTEYNGGEGHAYNIDGFKTYLNYQNFYHVNFGWGTGKTYNGYFLEGIILLEFTGNPKLTFPYNMTLYSIY